MMTSRLDGLIDKGALRRWDRAAEKAAELDPVALKSLQSRALLLGRQLERFVHSAENRLTAPASIPKPLHTDWAWRPDLFSAPCRPSGITDVGTGTEFGRGFKVFHDCVEREIALRQVRNGSRRDRAPFGLRLDVFRFMGKFLSLAIDLPKEGVRDLSRRHLVRIGLNISAERPVKVFGRLNVRHGPNTEQFVRQFDLDNGLCHVDLDLAGSGLDEERVERAWADIIFEAPAMNGLRLSDLTLTRRPRAEF